MYSKLPKRVRFDVPDEDQELFARFSLLSVVRGMRIAEAYKDAIESTLTVYGDLLTTEDGMPKNWMNWEEFEPFMRSHGFTVNRTTFWNYRNAGKFEAEIKTDGVSTVYDADGILEYFVSGSIQV